VTTDADSAALTDARAVPGTRGMAARHPVGMVAIGVALFSIGPVIVADAGISGAAFSFWRLWIGVALMAAIALGYRRATGATAGRTGWAWAAGCGVAFAAHQITFMSALQVTSVVDVTLMATIAPVVVGILAVPLFGERPGARFRLWSALAMLGAAGVALAGSTGPQGQPVGMVLAVANVIFYAVYFVGSKAGRPHIDTIPFLFGVMLAAALTVSAWVLLIGEEVRPIDGGDIARCVAVALLPGFVGHFTVTWALKWVPANLPPVLMLAIPPMSGAMAWAVLHQPVSTAQVAAGIVTIVGVAGAVRSPSAHELGADDALSFAEEA